MKKNLFAILALPALVAMSCSNEEPISMESSSEGNVTFVAQLPGGINSRSFADGTTATQLSYAVYEAGSTAPLLKSGDPGAPAATFTGLQARLSLNLAKGKSYDIVFWADQPGNTAYTFEATTQTVTVNYDGLKSNDESRDAFFQVEKNLEVNGPVQKTISLYRPFAQVNVGTNDLAAAGVSLGQTKLTVDNVYSQLNLFTGEASMPTQVVYDFAEIPSGETFPVAGYEYLSMNYILSGTEVLDGNVNTTQKELVNCSFEVVDANGKPVNTVTLSNLPIQRNYRTNIYGALLSSQVDYTVEIKPGFNEPGFDHEVIDIPAGKVMMGTELFETIADALGAASGSAELTLGAGTFTLPSTLNGLTAVSIDGSGDAKVVYPEGVANIDAAGAAVTLKNVTFSTPVIAGSNFPGFNGAKTETYDNVNFVDGCLAPLCEELVISNSTFTVNPQANLDTQYKYALSFRYRNGGKVQKGTITNTEFITHMGTAVTAYNCATDLTFEGCRFTNAFNGDALKDAQSAIVYANAQPTGEFKHTLALNNCSQTGFLGHYLSDSKLWAAKTGQMLSVTIDGVEQVQPIVSSLDRKTFTLYSPAALGLIAKMVNEGYWRDGVFAADRMSGCTVKLAADIDMAGVAFTPIGVAITSYPSKHFAGTFDGQNHTISNLTASDNTPNYAAAGLFGGLVGHVKDLVLRNVNITSTHYAGGIAGYVDNETGSQITNCQVIGGSITSTTEMVGGSWDNGDKVGGILGYGCIGNDKVTGCTVENLTIKAYRHFAPIVGFASKTANVTDNTATNVTLLWDGTNDYKGFGSIGNVPFGDTVGNVKGVLAGNTATSVTQPE